MEKVVLVDGNNLLFRSYYATAYTGNIMRNSEGFPTNGLFGFVNMMNKIISEENPSYIMVAFDVGKTFRHEEFDFYKDGRNETPDELKRQFPVAKEILTAMGIKYVECPGYEADDIIGTFAKMIDEDENYTGLIVSSDKDLLQLISSDVSVKLLKTKDYVRMDREVFKDTYGVEPIRMIDLKGLMGDASDNIPGVKGIGEKTAMKLLQQYDTIENLYAHLEEIKGAVKTKLEVGRDSAFMSKKIATIFKEVPIDIGLDEIRYGEVNLELLKDLYKRLDFHSFLKNINLPKKEEMVSVKIVEDLSSVKVMGEVAVYLDLSEDNYHNASVLGMAVYNREVSFYIPVEVLKENPEFLRDNVKYTYDLKKMYVSLRKCGILIDRVEMDLMVAGYLLNYNIKDDIAYLMNELGYSMEYYNKKEKLSSLEMADRSIRKAKFIFDNSEKFRERLGEEGIKKLYFDIELPLTLVLGKMEYEGIRVSKEVLVEMGSNIKKEIERLTGEIYDLAGVEFNISSPKQLGEVLFERLELPGAKKNKTGYVTDATVLEKLKVYPIVEKILDYRMYTKLYSTYIEGIINSISEDGKIHTIYTQTLTRTGRLSSIEPNLQNIPVRNEYGRMIRKAFVPDGEAYIMSSDYSQIELRLFAHLSNNHDLIEAFRTGLDIHRKTASDVFRVKMDDVTKEMRRSAKAVNFGILYGISSYGLATDLGISNKSAKEFINSYFETYPGIKSYMEEVIAKAHTEGVVVTIMNRKRVIDELNSSNYNIRSMGERMALNTPIQGSSADILKKAMVEIDREFSRKKLKSKMLLQVHDELIFNCLKEEREQVEEIVRRIMENVFELKVPLVVDIEYGNNWYEAK